MITTYIDGNIDKVTSPSQHLSSSQTLGINNYTRDGLVLTIKKIWHAIAHVRFLFLFLVKMFLQLNI